MSAIQRRFEAEATKLRETRSGAGCESRSRTVVNVPLLRVTPCKPLRRIRRATRFGPTSVPERRAQRASAERRRSLGTNDESRGSAPRLHGRSARAPTSDASLVPNTRWRRRPACGTSWRFGAWPGASSRTRTPRRRRAGLLRKPGRGFFQYFLLFAKDAHLAL